MKHYKLNQRGITNMSGVALLSIFLLVGLMNSLDLGRIDFTQFILYGAPLGIICVIAIYFLVINEER